MTQRHFRELDGIRGLLAVTVVAFHYGLGTAIARFTAGAVTGGAWQLCVDVFFVLSGFVLCRSMSAAPSGWRGYAAKRWLRLAPAFLVTTTLMIALDAASIPRDTIAANLLVVQSLVGRPSINFPAWSIPLELFLPAAGILLVPALRRCSRAQLAVLLGLLAILEGAGFFLALRNGTLDTDLVRGVRAAVGLASGAILYLVWDAYRPRASAPGTYAALAGIVGAMALAGVVPAVVVLFPVLAFAALLCGAELDGLFSSAPAQAIGRWSYSIYLVHIPVLMVSQRLFGEEAVRGAASKSVLFFAVLVISAALYRFIEEPFMRIGRAHAASRLGVSPTRP